MRKPTFCICENKDADQLRGNHEADQRLCFRYLDSMIPLLSKSEISSLWPSSVAVQPGLCRTRSETRLLVFSRRGSFVCVDVANCYPVHVRETVWRLCILLTTSEYLLCNLRNTSIFKTPFIFNSRLTHCILGNFHMVFFVVC